MRQLKNCKVGHFVKYEGVICQVNCFYSWMGRKLCTLIQVGEPHESKRMFNPDATEKVEYLGETATDENGTIWFSRRRDPVQEWNNR